MNTETIVAIVFGVIGTITGSVALIRDFIKDKPQIKLKLIGISGEPEKKTLGVQVINKSDYPIKIEDYGIFYSLKSKKYNGSVSIMVGEKNSERVILEIDNRFLNVDIDMIRRDADFKRLKYFFVSDTTNRYYKIKLPLRISEF